MLQKKRVYNKSFILTAAIIAFENILYMVLSYMIYSTQKKHSKSRLVKFAPYMLYDHLVINNFPPGTCRELLRESNKMTVVFNVCVLATVATFLLSNLTWDVSSLYACLFLNKKGKKTSIGISFLPESLLPLSCRYCDWWYLLK